MTHEDLGLPLGQWAVSWLTRMYGVPMDFIEPKATRYRSSIYWQRWHSDARYAFWLGADA